MPWKKGESGNPSGRVKVPEDVRELAKAHTLDAIKVHVEVMQDKKAQPGARVAAASAVLDRAWGKPAQTINANVRRSLSELTRDELLDIASRGRAGDTGEGRREGDVSSVH